MMRAADFARDRGLSNVIAVEFGVAAGRGLMNLGELSKRVTRETGVEFQVFGLDGGAGMPPPRDYRDHPDLYQAGDFPMVDREGLKRALPPNVELLLGDLTTSVSAVLRRANRQNPIGFVSFDVDYYYSTMDALTLFDGPPDSYLPATVLYFDDTQHWMHNQWCGEFLAINEFNAAHQWRKIDRAHYIKNSRIYRNAHWLDQIFTLHVLDHPTRHNPPRVDTRVLENPHLRKRDIIA
ncbi:MAG: hypothetical protein JO302_03150 [Candidatus Eremiobacteraeota bacterium]|nr:hypothetical protein [Candidatus Eremiobacteraeota bacterium]